MNRAMPRAVGPIFTFLCAWLTFLQPLLAAPQRVVSTFLCTDEYVYRLVPREKIAALSFEATDRHPVVSTIADGAIGIPTIRPTTETVLSRNPDLVVMYAGTNSRLHASLKRLNIPVLDVPWANSLADVRAATMMLGEKLGAPDKAKALVAEMDRKIALAKKRAPQPPVTGILYQPNGYAAEGGYIGEVMTIAGIASVVPASRLTRAGTLPVEAVIASAPELLILGGEEKSGFGLAYMILHHPGLKALEGRTLMQHAVLTPLLCPGPWSVDAALPLGDLARKARTLARYPARN